MFITSEQDEELNAMMAVAKPTLDEHELRLSRFETMLDPAIRVESDRFGCQTYAIEFRNRLSADQAHHLRPRTEPVLVITPYVGPSVAAALRERGVDYIDGAGNIRIDWPNLRIDVQGRPRQHTAQPPSPRASRAFTAAGVRLTFVLLSWPELRSAPLRTLADASRTSLGTAHAVVADLDAAGYLGPEGRLHNGSDLLDRWTEAYANTVAPKLTVGRFRDNDRDWWTTAFESLPADGVQLGGEAAASVIDDHLLPTSAILYTDEVPRSLAARQRWIAAGDDANVEVRRRFWENHAPHTVLVPSTLVYADLATSRDPRLREHAQKIRGVDDRLVALHQS